MILVSVVKRIIFGDDSVDNHMIVFLGLSVDFLPVASLKSAAKSVKKNNGRYLKTYNL
jgi:hypothetical protein